MIVETLYGSESFKRSPLNSGVIRMSLSEGCPRYEGYLYLGYPTDSWGSARRQASADDGKMHEMDVVSRLLNQGYKLWNYGEQQTQTYLRTEGTTFRGHPDLFLEKGNSAYGADVKAYRDEIFDKYAQGSKEIGEGIYVSDRMDILMQRPYPLMGQMQLYLHSEEAEKYGIQEWLIIMKNKNTAELLEFSIPKDAEYVKNLVKKWRSFWGYMTAKRLPPRFFEQDSPECERCPFYEQCWGKPLQKLEKRKASVDYLHDAVIGRREGLKLKKNSEILIQYARHEFLLAAMKEKANEVSSEGLTAKVSERTRKGLDVAKAEDFLLRLKAQGVLTDEQLQNLYAESDYTEVRFTDRAK